MASRKPKDIIEGLIPFAGDRPLEDTHSITLLNMANHHFSAYANWRWLTRPGSEIDLAANQTYDWTSTSPILKVIACQIINKGGQISTIYPVSSVAVSDSGSAILPSTFEFIPQAGNAGQLKVWPKPPVGVNGKLIPIEKKKTVLISNTNFEVAGTLEYPDDYEHVFEFFLLDLMYLWAQAGPQTQVATGQQRSAGVSGALARAYQAADKIVSTEALFVDPIRNQRVG